MTEPLEFDVWTDYLCPWAYLGRHHTNWLRSQGATPAFRAFELHPELPADGRPIRPGGRFHTLLGQLTSTAADLGLEMRIPERIPNTRRALEVLELVGRLDRARQPAFDEAVSRAVWIDGRAIDDAHVLDSIVSDLGLDLEALRRDLDDGLGAAAVAGSRALALDAGVTGTPAWCVAGLTVTGLHPDDQFRRWVGRIIERRPRP